MSNESQENFNANLNKNYNLSENKSEDSLKFEILHTQLECAKLQQQTALNELKASEVKRKMIEKEAEEKFTR